MGMKTCSACHQELPPDYFSPDKRAVDGRQSRCRVCCRDAQRKRYQSDPESAAKRQREYNAKNPEKISAINKRGREKNTAKIAAGKKTYYEKKKRDPAWQVRQASVRAKNKYSKKFYDQEYRVKNRSLLNAKSKKKKAANPELYATIQHSYKARRRSHEAGGDSTALIHAWKIAQDKVCHWCGCDCSDGFHIDHYIPLSKGGLHVVHNLVISCPPCNIRKNNIMPDEFRSRKSCK